MQSDGGERDIKRGILLCLGGLFSLISGARGDDAVVHQAGGEELYRDRGGYRGLYIFNLDSCEFEGEPRRVCRTTTETGTKGTEFHFRRRRWRNQ